MGPFRLVARSADRYKFASSKPPAGLPRASPGRGRTTAALRSRETGLHSGRRLDPSASAVEVVFPKRDDALQKLRVAQKRCDDVDRQREHHGRVLICS